jgi:hypothetical protein
MVRTRPTKWSDINIKELRFEYTAFDCANLKGLDRLEHLEIQCGAVANLHKLQSCGKLVRIHLFTKMTQEVCQEFLNLVRNSHIKEVTVYGRDVFDDETFVHQLESIPHVEYINIQGRTRQGKNACEDYIAFLHRMRAQ